MKIPKSRKKSQSPKKDLKIFDKIFEVVYLSDLLWGTKNPQNHRIFCVVSKKVLALHTFFYKIAFYKKLVL